MRRVLAVLVLLAVRPPAPPLAGQEASRYLPLNNWAMPFIEHLIASGRIADPSPLTRPFRVDQIARALAAVDSNAVSVAEWRLVEDIRRDIDRTTRGPSARLDVAAGVAASSYARRDPLRATGARGAGGPGHATFSGGAGLTLYFGPVVV
ncbi:MAG TPA: hypothetical protein VKQ05_06235, partial [Gemmatimonadales bacterium]|nr:hypothetical protein [Gemmatimonadales bacterium]